MARENAKYNEAKWKMKHSSDAKNLRITTLPVRSWELLFMRYNCIWCLTLNKHPARLHKRYCLCNPVRVRLRERTKVAFTPHVSYTWFWIMPMMMKMPRVMPSDWYDLKRAFISSGYRTSFVFSSYLFATGASVPRNYNITLSVITDLRMYL